MIYLILILSKFSSSEDHKYNKETFTYKVIDGEELKLDKIIDLSVKNKRKKPIFMYIHGGEFTTGSRINVLQQRYCKHYASQGYTSFLLDYRLSLKCETAEEIVNCVKISVEDLIDATNYILNKATEWNLDVNKFIITGGSAGAIICLTTEYEIVNDYPYTKKLSSNFNYAGVISHAGAVIEWGENLKWKRKPCPLMLMHGTNDSQVPFNTQLDDGMIIAGSNYIHNQLKEMNVSHYFYVEDEADHIVALKPMQYNLDEIDTFLKKFVWNETDAIVHQLWKDKVPGSMSKMNEIVPLYINGWDRNDDGFYSSSKTIGKTAKILIICLSVFVVIIIIVIATLLIIKKKKKDRKESLRDNILA